MDIGGRKRARIARWSFAATLAVTTGCVSWSERTAEFRSAYGQSRFDAAEASIDRLLVDETGVDPEIVAQPKALARDSEATDGDGEILLLEKGMARLGRGDADGAIELFRRSRDQLEQQWKTDALEYVGASAFDDRVFDYAGADYEHVLVRVMLALSDLVLGGPDALAYSFQIGEKQEEILQSDFGAAQGYAPRERYRRIALGAYLEGVLHESRLARGDAVNAYQRALAYHGSSSILEEAIARARDGVYAPAGEGVIHVFRLVGRGPFFIEGHHPPTDLANHLAGVAVALSTRRASAFVQVPIKVPVVAVTDADPMPMSVSIDGGLDAASTETLLDVNAIAIEQLEANLPWIIARALVRRALKAVAASYIEEGVRRSQRNELGFLAGAAFNVAATAAESADTRSWSLLPAVIQVARITAPAGRHVLNLDATSAPIVVTAGHESFVLVLQPDPAGPATALVDVDSRPADAGP